LWICASLGLQPALAGLATLVLSLSLMQTLLRVEHTETEWQSERQNQHQAVQIYR
jgi:hypothetical protein